MIARLASILVLLGTLGVNAQEQAPGLVLKDARYALVLAGERAVPLDSVYQKGRHILRNKTQGLLQVLEESDAQAMLEVAGLPQGRTLRTSEIGRLARVAASQGVDYIIAVDAFDTSSRSYTYQKNSRQKIVGGLGISYATETTGIETKASLSVSVWHCKTAKLLFSQRFEGTDGGGVRERRDLEEWLGLAVVQRLMPESTGTERNPIKGDFVMRVHAGEMLRLVRRNPSPSGVTGRALLLPITAVMRSGDLIHLVMPVENLFDRPLRLDFSQARSDVFCLDKNGMRYELLRSEGILACEIPQGGRQELRWIFQIPDRNVDFVNLHLRVQAALPPDFEGKGNLQWKNIQLFTLEAPDTKLGAVVKRKTAANDGSAWQMREVSGRMHTAKSCAGQPVVVFFCGSSALSKTWLLGENTMIGTAASIVSRQHKKYKDSGFSFLWVDDSAVTDPVQHKRAASKFDLNMPVIVPEEEFVWPFTQLGSPGVAIFDADGKLVRILRGADEVRTLDAHLQTMPLRPGMTSRLGALLAGDAPLLEAVHGAEPARYPVVTGHFDHDMETVWAALIEQSRVGELREYPLRAQRADRLVYTRTYIYEGYWNIFAAQRKCLHAVQLIQEKKAVRAEVMTILLRQTKDVVNKSGVEFPNAVLAPNYLEPERSSDLSKRFLDGLRKRLKSTHTTQPSQARQP